MTLITRPATSKTTNWAMFMAACDAMCAHNQLNLAAKPQAKPRAKPLATAK